MRVLLDECLPLRLVRDLPDHTVTTVARIGMAGSDDAGILDRARELFDVFITIDSNLVHQQNLSGLSLCVIVLHARSNRYEVLQPLVPALRNAIAAAKPGKVVDIPGRT